VTKAELTLAPNNVVARLIDLGLEPGVDRKATARLISLLKRWKPVNRLTTVDHAGWVDDSHRSFVIGAEAIGAPDILPRLRFGPGLACHLTSAGDIAGWKKEIGALCRNNPMMVLAASLAFSGPLLSMLNMQSGGLHFRGVSSSGKTTLLQIAASVWGRPKLITQWNATKNGLEAIAATLNDMLLPLDELGAVNSGVLSDTIYMLGNGTGKQRMTVDIAPAEAAQWRLALISSGEITVAQKLAETGKTQMLGQEVRLIDIEADGRAHGVFDDLHGAADGSAFADRLKAMVGEQHGTVGRDLVRILRADPAKMIGAAEIFISNFLQEAQHKLPSLPDGAVMRVAQRFAVIAFAGELAIRANLTGWNRDTARQVALAAFLDWHDRRHGEKHEKLANLIKPLQQFFTSNLANLPEVGAESADTSPPGWKDQSCVYLTTETWLELFPGASGPEAAKAFLDLQMLRAGDDGRSMRKAPRAIPGRPRLYTLNTAQVMGYKAP
jgi:putative DNA primase/helicase